MRQVEVCELSSKWIEWEKIGEIMFFNQVVQAEADPIFGLLGAFGADTRPQKVNLTVGIYKDDDLSSTLLSSVKKGKEQIFDQDLMADYLPMDGLKKMTELLGEVLFGDHLWKSFQEKIYAAHTVGGTGALRVGTEFLIQEGIKNICIPNYTWPNHRSILEKTGAKIGVYPYYSREKKGFDFDQMGEFLEKLPEKTAPILHACCHNPTGCDPTIQEWKEISLIMKERKLFPFFDCAYQGLGEGLEKDSEAIRIFLEDGHEMLIGYSCSKNFSMYCQRVGTLFAVTENGTIRDKVGSQIKKIIRSLYSNPPAHGARIVTEVLLKEDLKRLWHKDLEQIRFRLKGMRENLTDLLQQKNRDIDFSYLNSHKGMFSFVDLTKLQVKKLIDQFAVYLLDNGRISVAGLNSKNIEYVADSITSVCK